MTFASVLRAVRLSGFVFALAAGCANAAELKPWTGGATPALELKDLDGAPVRLADYRGKVVLLNFWATWCEPCRDEMPSIQSLKRRLAGRPFEVIAVNYGESENKVREYLARYPVDFRIPLDRFNAVRRDWNVKLLPTSFVIGIDGNVRYVAIGEFNWADDAAVASLLKLLPPR